MTVLAVNSGDGADVIRRYFAREKLTFTPLRQKDDEINRAYGVQAFPTNYVIAPDGRVAWRSVGFDEKGLRAAIEKLATPR